MSKTTTYPMFIVCVLCVVLCTSLLAAACDDSEVQSPSNVTEGDTSDDAETRDQTSVIPDEIDVDTVTPACDVSNGQADTDGDGITNEIEIAATYDPCDPDTDGDGLCDGPQTVEGSCISGEDLNANGRQDAFEPFNALIPDNATATPTPCQVTKSLVCNAQTYSAIQAKPARSARTNLALPASFTITEHEVAKASAFSDPAAGVYGYAIKQTVEQSSAAIIFRTFETIIGIAGHTRTNAFWSVFTSQTGDVQGLERNAVQSRGRFSYGVDSANPDISSQDPAALRDIIISSVAGVSVITPGIEATPCANIISHHIEERREGNVAITLGLLACEADYQQPDTALFFEHFLTGTQQAIAEEVQAFAPAETGCDCFLSTETSGAVDFLWIIDNSGSMADEQGLVAATAASFMDLLQSTSIDWRLAVASTDAYCLGLDLTDPAVDPIYEFCVQQVEQDPELERCTGLRGLSGFLSASAPDVRGAFDDLVTKNSACLNPQNADPGSNVCGFGLESGLRTAEFVIDQLLNTSLGPDCPSGPAYQLRKGPNQKTVVIWVSDEEDEEMKAPPSSTNPPPGTILASTSPARLAKNQYYQDIFDAYHADHGLDLSLHAIVGDQGNSAGGICAPLAQGGILGAQTGLGYIDAVQANGGAVGTICASNLTVTINAIIRSTIGQTSSYPLPAGSRPIASSIRVAVENSVIKGFDDGQSPYWTYDAAQNAITFFRIVLQPGTPIAVAFKGWLPVEQ